MKTDIARAVSIDRKAIGLLPGSLVAAFMALVFGMCLCTILDAIHRPVPTAASATSRSSQPAAKVVTVSF